MTDVRRRLPAVSTVLEHPDLVAPVAAHGRGVVTDWVRSEIDAARAGIEAGDEGDPLTAIIAGVLDRANEAAATALGPVVNATGVVLHTGLGRAPLADVAIEAVRAVSAATNLEIDLADGRRLHRGHQLLPSFRTLTGCEDALVVNNNAAATLLVLAAHCAGGEVVISRGQLVEIGGSFRLPEIFRLAGVTLREVGTTNRTTLADYEAAIGDRTAAILRVHPSNYRIEGFAAMPEIESLVPLAREHGIVCIDDIGSGCLVDTTRLGLPAEPTFRRSIEAGADLVLGSGDKLLGGPQAGIVVGTGNAVGRLRTHPYARTVRADKLALAGLDATLRVYQRGEEWEEIPTLSLLAAPVSSLRSRAESIAAALEHSAFEARVHDDVAAVGGGSLPGTELPTVTVALTHPTISAEEIATRLRTAEVRVLPRVRDDRVLLDLRSVRVAEDAVLVSAVGSLARVPQSGG